MGLIEETLHHTLKEITHEFDSNVGSLSINIQTLKNINIELGQISDDVSNVDKTQSLDLAFAMLDIEHKIHILSDLLRYTVKEMDEAFEHTETIKRCYYDLIVRESEENKKADAGNID